MSSVTRALAAKNGSFDTFIPIEQKQRCQECFIGKMHSLKNCALVLGKSLVEGGSLSFFMSRVVSLLQSSSSFFVFLPTKTMFTSHALIFPLGLESYSIQIFLFGPVILDLESIRFLLHYLLYS